jgi:DNA-binding GntR family transcriptional regulator
MTSATALLIAYQKLYARPRFDQPLAKVTPLANTDSLQSVPKRGDARALLATAAMRRVRRPALLREVVYDALLELIISGSLRPGQHLVEAELAEHLGVSRQPVREALQRLQTEGWVDLRPAQGAFVHTPTDAEAREFLSVRGVLETYAAGLAATHSTPPDIERLWELQQEGLDALAADDANRLVAANSALHAFITGIAGNTVLAELISLVERRVRWYYTPIARPRGKDAWTEHAKLIKAIADSDDKRASETMRRHTERTTAFYQSPQSAAAEPGR